MAKLIYSVLTSLDGYIADEDVSFDWAVPDEEVLEFVKDLERPVGTYLYGRLDARIPAAHLFAFPLGAVQSWAIASDALRDAADADAARERQRESVREAVARVTGTSTG